MRVFSHRFTSACCFFFSSRRRHKRFDCDWSSDVCSSDLTALMLLAFWWLWRLRVRRHAVGWRFGVYLVLAGAERLLVEFVRAKDDRLLGSFTLAQLTSVLVMAGGVWVIGWLRGPEAAPVPAALMGTTAADDLARRH